MLDTLVRLAAFGATGVCILIVFWIGFIIKKPNKEAGSEWHKTVRLYMATCLGVAVIAGTTGVANAMFNMDKVNDAEDTNRGLHDALEKRMKELSEIQIALRTLESTNTFPTPRGNWTSEQRQALQTIQRFEAQELTIQPSIRTQPIDQ